MMICLTHPDCADAGWARAGQSARLSGTSSRRCHGETSEFGQSRAALSGARRCIWAQWTTGKLALPCNVVLSEGEAGRCSNAPSRPTDTTNCHGYTSRGWRRKEVA
ncbi:unnamed protein product [Protopolystoma xenopodis]|uniref:Uncharacterized protein n=1 Tax=Protopolystoma xenopodis TaxID=117903 RepID=A0A3S5AIY4_9PLAT|nr:unnamed protein product [Protopolystoma xenopodis]